jgi:L-ascorbate metabolism protein UlaG (beta-lactamase superfamily)
MDSGQPHNLDFVLCSHRHGDHMDPGTLPVLAQHNPSCRFVVPRAERASAIKLGLRESHLIVANDGDTIRLSDSVELQVIPAAHETLQVNEQGEHHFLGFILRLGGTTIYHSGDSVVYQGLAERLGKLRIELALLPVNGRSQQLNSRGIAGNMNFDEACELCLAAGIRAMIPHHWGMFAFNTADPNTLRWQIAGVDAARLQCVIPEADSFYTLARY